MANAKFDLKTTLPSQAVKPVLAYVGATDLAVEMVRGYVAGAQKRFEDVSKDVSSRVGEVQKTVAEPTALRDQALTVVTGRVDALAKDAQARRAAVEARVAELQDEAKAYPAKVASLVDGNVAVAAAAYDDLVKRGESLVGRIRRQPSTQATVASAKTTSAKAKTTVTQAKKAAEAQVDAAEKTAEVQQSAAKSTATTATKKADAKKSTAKKAPAKKAAATRTAKKGAQKTAGKKSAATKATSDAAKKTAVAQSSAKAATTAATNTATNAVQAVADAAEKVGD